MTITTNEESFQPFHTSRRDSGSLATPQTRLVAFMIDGFIFGITLGVGWIIWLAILAQRGTTPGHHLMGQKIVDNSSGKNLSVIKILIRELLIKGLFSWIIGGMTMMLNYVIDGAFIFTEKKRTVHDLIMGSTVIQVRSNFMDQ